MAEQLEFRDNFGSVEIHNHTGRPSKNPKESLSSPISIRLYESEKEMIQERMFEHDMSRNEVIQKCIQAGLHHWDLLDWILNNSDTIQTLAERYNRKYGGV